VVNVPSDPVVVPVATRVSFTAPTAGAAFGKSLTAAATAAPAPGRTVKRVEFWFDGARIARDTSAPYRTIWTAPRRLSTGLHTLSARAIDSGGAIVSTAVTVLHTNGTLASTVKSGRLSAATAAAQLSSEPAGDGGTDLTGATRVADAVTATLAPCSAKSATKSKKMTLQAVDSQLSGHQRTGRLCVVGLSPSDS
jgi:hypothetical protein